MQKVQAARVAELQLESLHTLGKEILSDLSGFADVSFKLSAAVKEAESQRQELTETWVRYADFDCSNSKSKNCLDLRQYFLKYSNL